MASRNGKKSSGLRMLWIPGRKSHPKGRFDSTNKNVSYANRQKKSQVWSLGGSRAQSDLIRAEPDVSLLDGPSTSGLATIACATATGTAAAAATATSTNSASDAPISPSADCPPAADSIENSNRTSDITTPTTPNSTTSTALLLSAPQSPFPTITDLDSIESESEYPSNAQRQTMPAKSHQMEPPMPVKVTSTTTAQIIEENRYSILGKDMKTNEFDIYTLPSPPSTKDDEHLNNSSGTTASQKSSYASSPHKDIETSSTTESHQNHNNHNQTNGSLNNTPTKKKQHRNHNNNQGDVNSIESITEDSTSAKIPSADLDWIDNVIQDRNDREILAKPKKKKKNKHSNAKELDQLDGVPIKENSKDDPLKEEDEKMVKCLYYTLMCCDCTIS